MSSAIVKHLRDSGRPIRTTATALLVIRCLTAGNPASPPKPPGTKKPVEVTTPQPATFSNNPVSNQ